MSILRVVLAESNIPTRDALLMMLADGQPPPQICVEANGEGLLRTLRQCTVDAVIVSDSLPDHDVSSLIRDLSPNLLACPIIVVAHRREQDEAVRCFRSGVSDFIPVDEATTPDVLWRTVIQAVLTYRRQASERRCSERRQRLLQKAADTDAMTGLFNRRYFRQCCEQQHWARDRRRYLAVNLIDVDGFKQINDRYGHAAGDVMIRAVAQQIRQHCQPADLAFRWGGDEFLVLRYASDMCESWIWAERLRSKVEQMHVNHGGRPIGSTLSIGTTLVTSQKFNEDAIEHADQSLYSAKRCGRNRVCTEDMARVISTSDRITRHAGLDIEQRRTELLRLENTRLGPVQRRHLTQHSQATGQIGWLLGRAMGLTDESALHVRRIGLLHDMGKLVMPEVLLGKTEPLNSEEWSILSQSRVCSALVAEHLKAPPPVTNTLKVMSRPATPGSSYDSEIDLLEKITRVADALASMLGGRVYRPPMRFQDALTELGGRTFDPQVVSAAHKISPPSITRLAMAA